VDADYANLDAAGKFAKKDILSQWNLLISFQ